MEDLNADIERLIAEANAERDAEENTQDDNNNDVDDNNDSNNGDGSSDDTESTSDEENSDSVEGEDNGTQGSNEDESGQEESSKDKEEEFTKIKTKVNGQEIVLESKEEVEKFIETQNRQMQSTRPSEVEEIVTQAKLSQEDLRLLADIKAGKPGALKKLADTNKIDLADADEFDGDYNPEFTPEIKSDIDIVLDNINANTELAPKFNEVVSTLPDDFLSAIGSNAHDLQQFASHVESGLAAELLPQAIKLTSLGQGSLLDNYIKLGEAKFANKDNSSKPQTENKRHISEKEKKLRDRASSDADKNKGGKSSDFTVEDLWNEDNLLDKVRNGEIDLRNLD